MILYPKSSFCHQRGKLTENQLLTHALLPDPESALSGIANSIFPTFGRGFNRDVDLAVTKG